MSCYNKLVRENAMLEKNAQFNPFLTILLLCFSHKSIILTTAPHIPLWQSLMGWLYSFYDWTIAAEGKGLELWFFIFWSLKELEFGLIQNFFLRTSEQARARKVCLRLTGYLLDLVDHHKGIRQAHLHWVIDRADLWHFNGDLKWKWRKSITRTTTICLRQAGKWKWVWQHRQYNQFITPIGVCWGIMQL